MRHIEEAKRKINQIDNSVFSDEYSSYGEALYYVEMKSQQNMLEYYVLHNPLFNEETINEDLYKYIAIIKKLKEDKYKSYTDASDYYKVRGCIKAIEWLLQDSEIKDILIEENNTYKLEIMKLENKLNELKYQVLKNEEILKGL